MLQRKHRSFYDDVCLVLFYLEDVALLNTYELSCKAEAAREKPLLSDYVRVNTQETKWSRDHVSIWVLTRSSSNIASIMLRFTKSCQTHRIRLWASITRSIDFWISASIARSWENQRSSWSSLLSHQTRFLTKFNQTRNQKSRTSSLSSSKCVQWDSESHRTPLVLHQKWLILRRCNFTT
jgi:hypothetical protein